MGGSGRPPGAPSPAEPFVPDLSEGAEAGVYLALLELIDEGLIITGDEFILDANSAACHLLGRDYRQVAGRSLSALFPTEEAFLDVRARLLIQGTRRWARDGAFSFPPATEWALEVRTVEEVARDIARRARPAFVEGLRADVDRLPSPFADLAARILDLAAAPPAPAP